MRRQVSAGTIADDDELSTDFRHLAQSGETGGEFVGQRELCGKMRISVMAERELLKYVVVWEEQLGRNVH